jgi:hypothetical protein
MYDNGFATRFGMDIAFTALLMGPQRSHMFFASSILAAM